MKTFIIVAAGCLLLLMADISTAQKTQSKTIDTALLRTQLAEALGDQLTIVKDETTRRSNWHGGQLFWLVNVQPKASAIMLLSIDTTMPGLITHMWNANSVSVAGQQQLSLNKETRKGWFCDYRCGPNDAYYGHCRARIVGRV